jgi:hypothetical protein
MFIELLSSGKTLKDLVIFYINSSQYLIVTLFSLMKVVNSCLSSRTLANELNQQYIIWFNSLCTKYLTNHTE